MSDSPTCVVKENVRQTWVPVAFLALWLEQVISALGTSVSTSVKMGLQHTTVVRIPCNSLGEAPGTEPGIQ